MKTWPSSLLSANLAERGTALPSDDATIKSGSKVLTQLLELDSLIGILDGKGNMPPGTIQSLKDQISELQNESYGDPTYNLDDYAISIGGNLGIGDDADGEIDAVAKKIESRRI